jgi:hypothetical protein
MATKTTSNLKSKKNLTRMTQEAHKFNGWRLCVSKTGNTFYRYFSDKQFGGGKESLAAAEKTLAEMRAAIAASKLVNGKLTAASVKQIEKLMGAA